jgi:splicing factor 3B subunit 1
MPASRNDGPTAKGEEGPDADISALQAERAELTRVSMMAKPGEHFDADLYGGGSSGKTDYVNELRDEDDDGSDDEDAVRGNAANKRGRAMTASQRASSIARSAAAELSGPSQSDAELIAEKRVTHGSGLQNTRVRDRLSDYQKKGFDRALSPERKDAFSKTANGGATGESYADVMKAAAVSREREELQRKIDRAQQDDEERLQLERQMQKNGMSAVPMAPPQLQQNQNQISSPDATPPRKKGKTSSRWGGDDESTSDSSGNRVNDDDATPLVVSGQSGGGGGALDDETPKAAGKSNRSSRWDSAPTPKRVDPAAATPAPGGASSRRSRWDETPVNAAGATPATGAGGAGGKKRSRWDVTPAGAGTTTTASTSGFDATPGGATPMLGLTPEAASQLKQEREMEFRNRPLSDEELDDMFPSKGYEILTPPPGYAPIRTPSRKLLATPTPMQREGFVMTGQAPGPEAYGIPTNVSASGGGDLPDIKPEDLQYFGKLTQETEEDDLTAEEVKERRIMKLLLKIKNGVPHQRKLALRQIADKARELGAGPLFNQILPLLMSPTLEDQERHLLVKVIDRVLYKLDDLVRPYVHKVLVVIEPLLIDEDYYARVEGREIISNLAKAAGLATMIHTMRPDIDSLNEYVRNTTARAFAVVASALGIPAMLPFLRAVCQSRKAWQARHTGIKIVQQIAILMGCAVLPHLRIMVDTIAHGLNDDQQKVKTITALALAALAEAAHPYGFESFESVLEPLFLGARQLHGKGLAAFLKACGYIVPLMDPEETMPFITRILDVIVFQFRSPDEEMKKIVLKVLKQCLAAEGMDVVTIREKVVPDFFSNFWVRRMALDRRNYSQLVETTVELAVRVGGATVVGRIVDDLKDESEPYRRMVMDAIDKVVEQLGATDIDVGLEERLVDGMLYAFQEQSTEENVSRVMLNGFGTVINALGIRAKPFLPKICGTIKWRLNNKSAVVRMQAADLVARIAVVMKTCGEEQLMGHLGVVLYELLGEEYPEVLGSILGALRSIVNVIGMSQMTPPIKDLLPRLTPILKNRHEKVQENCIDLVGRIADRGAEHVFAREWMRICFELLEMLKANKKAIRRATVNTFGYIAKAIGPQDVLHTLLNNLKVQDRQTRVCTTVAIAIVAETCGPFTVLPAVMSEYQTPDINVQHGTLKAMSFLFEYIGEMGKDYIHGVLPLLQDALIDRDLVHRQTACTTVRHLSLGVQGLGCEDALVDLLNLVWPNIFEVSPHVINAVFEAIEGIRVSLGAHVVIQYVVQGLFHPARRVREVFWKLYNNLYVYAQDALTPAYPDLEPDAGGLNDYCRVELEMFV